MAPYSAPGVGLRKSHGSPCSLSGVEGCCGMHIMRGGGAWWGRGGGRGIGKKGEEPGTNGCCRGCVCVRERAMTHTAAANTTCTVARYRDSQLINRISQIHAPCLGFLTSLTGNVTLLLMKQLPAALASSEELSPANSHNY